MKPSSPAPPSATTRANGHKAPNYGSFESPNASHMHNSGRQESKVAINWESRSGESGAAAAAEAGRAAAAEKKRPPSEESSLLLRLARRIPCLGIMLALLASLFLGSAGMLVKLTRSVHGIQVAVLRAAIQLVIYGFVIRVRKLPLWPDRAELRPVMGRALLGAISITCSYFALRLIPLGDATTIRFSLPIWTLIIGYLVLGEPCGALRMLAVVIAVSGVVLIAKPELCVYVAHVIWHSLHLESERTFDERRSAYESFRHNGTQAPPHLDPKLAEHQQLEGSLLALASSVCLSMSLIAMRLCRRSHAEIVILWLSICGIVIGSATLVALDEWSMPDNWLDVLYIALNGLCGAAGQWFITNALKVEQSGIISLVRTFDIEVAFLYSAFLLHEHIRVTSIIGSCLVTVGVLAVLVPKWLWPAAVAAGEPRAQRVVINGDSRVHQEEPNVSQAVRQK